MDGTTSFSSFADILSGPVAFLNRQFLHNRLLTHPLKLKRGLYLSDGVYRELVGLGDDMQLKC